MVWSKREDTKKKREPATVFFLFRVLKFSKKKKKSLSFSPLLSREKRKFFLKNEKKKHFSKNTFVGRERKTARRFLNHLSNHRIKSSSLSAVCVKKRETKDDDDDDDDDSSDDDFDDRIVENTAEFFFPWEEEWF